MKTTVIDCEATLRACMRDTPEDHPDYAAIQSRLRNAKPILEDSELVDGRGRRPAFPPADPRFVFPKN